jgi:ribose transport system ATP-binding protein
MGSGRSELARMIFGLDPFARGRILVEGKPLDRPSPASAMAAGIAFLTEDRRGEGLLMDVSIAENTILASLRRFAGGLGLIDRAAALREAEGMGKRVHLSTDRVRQMLAKHLSGGNQQKVVIGKWLMRQPTLFILDEPTRGIDVGAKQEVYRIINALVEAGSAVLLISSEIEELMGLSDRILTIRRGELTGAFERPEFDREAVMAAATGAAPAEAA